MMERLAKHYIYSGNKFRICESRKMKAVGDRAKILKPGCVRQKVFRDLKVDHTIP